MGVLLFLLFFVLGFQVEVTLFLNLRTGGSILLSFTYLLTICWGVSGSSRLVFVNLRVWVLFVGLRREPLGPFEP